MSCMYTTLTPSQSPLQAETLESLSTDQRNIGEDDDNDDNDDDDDDDDDGVSGWITAHAS